MSKETLDPAFDNENDDRDSTLKDGLGETIDQEDLNYNAGRGKF